MPERTYQADVVVAGGGLAGITAAIELLDHGKTVLLVDKDAAAKFGGLARESFGGIHLIDTRHQRRLGIRDSPDLAYRDWESFAGFEEADRWPRGWARFYCEHSREYIFRFLDEKKVTFLPIVNWPERGLFRPGNSVPRWHITWGTGRELVLRLIAALDAHPKRANLTVLFDHEVNRLDEAAGRVTGVAGRRMADDAPFEARAEHVVIASGGICGGDLSRVRRHWCAEWGAAPEVLLNGSHPYADGLLHDRVAALGGNLTHLDKQWHYAAGVHDRTSAKPAAGLSLVPPRSALWMNARGARIGPIPLVGYCDTRWLVASILREPGQYSWQVMNWKIAARELAVSGSEHMTAFVKKSKPLLLKHLLLGNPALVERLVRECPDDFAVADTLPELVDQMNARSLFGLRVDLERIRADILAYDEMIDRGPAFFNDEQLRRIMNHRRYRGDRLRTCKFQKILDPKARPLVAIREFILSRKSLGGIQTDLECRVLRADGTPVPGLYAIGEAAGFGGGGIHGRGSLEGTFLGSCVLTGRVAGQIIGCGRLTAAGA
jgi:uncharacterized protein